MKGHSGKLSLEVRESAKLRRWGIVKRGICYLSRERQVKIRLLISRKENTWSEKSATHLIDRLEKQEDVKRHFQVDQTESDYSANFRPHPIEQMLFHVVSKFKSLLVTFSGINKLTLFKNSRVQTSLATTVNVLVIDISLSVTQLVIRITGGSWQALQVCGQTLKAPGMLYRLS